MPVHSWQRQNRWENNLAIPCCFIYTSELLYYSGWGQTELRELDIIQPCVLELACIIHFQSKISFSVVWFWGGGFFVCLLLVWFFFLWGGCLGFFGGGQHASSVLPVAPYPNTSPKSLLCSLTSQLNTSEKPEPKMPGQLPSSNDQKLNYNPRPPALSARGKPLPLNATDFHLF